jgi:hypothetical protein
MIERVAALLKAHARQPVPTVRVDLPVKAALLAKAVRLAKAALLVKAARLAKAARLVKAALADLPVVVAATMTGAAMSPLEPITAVAGWSSSVSLAYWHGADVS